ncbi:chemotaxis protein CheW [Nocardioides yefusunii]|uniref:Chemotaxis protein CheW n=1 Tax=Nocardioides yefusunii TaxID=2500546 RepID=A0ABW1QXE8_9ACTN|nr:chemotaxis protein CheW [Nocardioides yefusunii]
MSTRLVTFTLDGRLYGVDVDLVQEVLRGQPQTRIPLAPASVSGLINLRGQVLSAMELRARLGLPDRDADTEAMLVVVRVDGEAIALRVDTIGAVIDVDDAQFELPPDTLTGPARDFLLGAYKLEGRLLLALDVARTVAA